MDELRSLVQRAVQGDPEAFGGLVRRFQDMAYGYAYSLLGDRQRAEDVAQESFLEAYRDLEQLREPAAFPGWLRQIVFHQCSRSTRRARVRTVPLEDASGFAVGQPGPAELAEQRELRDSIRSAIRALPEHERVVTTLFYINGYSNSDIAGFLDVPVSTVKSRLFTSRRRLKERMLEMAADSIQEGKPGSEFSARLFNGINLDKWSIEPGANHFETVRGELIVEHPSGEGCGLHARVGGPSWDDYRVGVDLFVESDPPQDGRHVNLQLCPRNTCVYCILYGDLIQIAYYDKESDPHFTHLFTSDPHPLRLGVWQRFEAMVTEGSATVFLNGEEIATRPIPGGTKGLLGLIVNNGTSARVRLRNMQITFLKPTPQQLRELETSAFVDWEEEKLRLQQDGTTG